MVVSLSRQMFHGMSPATMAPSPGFEPKKRNAGIPTGARASWKVGVTEGRFLEGGTDGRIASHSH